MKTRTPTLGDIGRTIGDTLERAKRNNYHYRNRPGTAHLPNWVDIFKRKLGAYMAAQGMPVEFWGPHGICARLTVKRAGKRFKRTVAIEPEHGIYHRAWRFSWRDFSRPTTHQRCPLNSIGDINGLNFYSELLPAKTPLSWFIEKLS